MEQRSTRLQLAGGSTLPVTLVPSSLVSMVTADRTNGSYPPLTHRPTLQSAEKGKPVARRGRKAMDLRVEETARLPVEGNTQKLSRFTSVRFAHSRAQALTKSGADR
jgi:hypothetical protein